MRSRNDRDHVAAAHLVCGPVPELVVSWFWALFYVCYFLSAIIHKCRHYVTAIGTVSQIRNRGVDSHDNRSKFCPINSYLNHDREKVMSEFEKCPWCDSEISREKFQQIESKIRKEELEKSEKRENEIKKKLKEKHLQEIQATEKSIEAREKTRFAKQLADSRKTNELSLIHI